MKNKCLAIIALPLLLLSSCDFALLKSSDPKEVNVYNLDAIDDDENVENALEDTITARFISGEQYIPYITFEQYARLYDTHLSSTATSKVTKNGSILNWRVTIDNSLYFSTQINFTERSVMIAGSLSSAFKMDDNPQDVAALEYGMNTDYEIVNPNDAGSYSYYSFNKIKLNYFSNGGEYYIPLSFLDITYSYDSGIYFFYNYAGIYSTHDADAFEDKTFRVDGAPMSVNDQMVLECQDTVMPRYLREYNANMFFYLFDNFYGFSDKITDYSRAMINPTASMAEFCRAKRLYNSLLSSDSYTRAQAYSDALSYFDDNHTAIVSANGAWSENSFSRFKYSTGCQNRSYLRNELTAKRQDVYGSDKPGEKVLYSSDGKTAMYMFDEFVFGATDEVFDETGRVDFTKAVKHDTFFKLATVFEDIKNHGGVQNIVLDISTNGGGVLGTMMKILSLISSRNSSEIFYMDGPTRQVISAKTTADANDDKSYNQEDCYGDDFKFYILTSDCSFSCGNAFPCYAKYNNIAKIIGQTSGGGECAVAIHFLPNSQYVYHSSNLHLGFYNDEEGFFGFESGAQPDIEINNTDQFFDIDYINGLLL